MKSVKSVMSAYLPINSVRDALHSQVTFPIQEIVGVGLIRSDNVVWEQIRRQVWARIGGNPWGV